ncbi:hypothetical protein HBI56_093970 [Parastagonospora nodorum]|uniref:Uncharacterized protein n=1 Tax=Phaeosphaeria nodorum (strain SN15 / ATCC MYA-4574 / FGSC 10173) TaxID=321614 RepID=A0A7U2I1A7_PHANO|nr:hypothetical protein HBH56_089260 [Parastagonospora nodorum]QRC98129.1 hypothetical protein JI435_042290 [Parastagonospora nodorum SN15]KAH3936569.1 hypothetical protein HBH54_023900 [Parastagonospora nodorum]KAH3945697.1 hypothetical protein HBH53_141000 [Parastagonospora nodorum]KAH3966258.1 hypothetical protein HBH51_144370 [Parastagonospora nodorum]
MLSLSDRASANPKALSASPLLSFGLRPTFSQPEKVSVNRLPRLSHSITMAPCKSIAEDKAQHADNVKKSNDRVIKRPAWGSHRFRGGMLNITPKRGTEKELVKSDQESCLLRLPTEIQNRIWIYAIGGRTIRQSSGVVQDRVFVPEPSERTNTFALMRACRQIYAETALLPTTTNVFQLTNCSTFWIAPKSFRKYQLRQIIEVRVEVNDLHFQRCYEVYLKQLFEVNKLSIFPNLRSVHFCVHGSKARVYTSLSVCSAFLHEHFGDQMRAAGYDMVVEKMDIDIRNHTR